MKKFKIHSIKSQNIAKPRVLFFTKNKQKCYILLLLVILKIFCNKITIFRYSIKISSMMLLLTYILIVLVD